MKSFFTTVFITLFAITGVIAQSDKDSKKTEKITAEELLAKHVASIGTPEALAAARTRVIVGEGGVRALKGYSGSLVGPVQLASDSERMLFVMLFNSNEYPYEKAAFDGKNASVATPNGTRTALSEFLKTKDSILEEGLFTGALSARWPLLNANPKKSRVEYSGTTKFGDRVFHKLKYSPRGASLRVSLFFETDTFRHVMTEYQYTVDVSIGVSSTDIQSMKDYYTLTEQFSDFKKVGDLTLPFNYTIALDVQKNSSSNLSTRVIPGGVQPGGIRTDSVSVPSLAPGTGSLQFTLKLGQVFFNEQLEPSVFKVS